MSEQTIHVAQGQIWRDNYDHGNGHVREVEILSVEGEIVSIRALSADGKAMPTRKTKASRFNGSKSGFSFARQP
jgi:hypothetical protein